MTTKPEVIAEPALRRSSESDRHNARESTTGARPDSDLHGAQSSIESSVQELYPTALQTPSKTLKTFKGNAIEYREFIRAFENRIASKRSSETEKLDFLLDYVEGEAREVIEDTPELPAESGYREARRLLERKYGRMAKAAIYEQRLMNWVEISYDDAEELDWFSTFMSKCANAMPIHEGLRCLYH